MSHDAVMILVYLLREMISQTVCSENYSVLSMC